MALVPVFVNVLEVRIERVVIEAQIGIGVGGALPDIGDGEVFGVEAPGAAWRGGRVFLGDGERPVVAIVAQRADQLLLGDDFDSAAEVVDEPFLAGDGSGLALDLVLVVVHQDKAIGVGGNAFRSSSVVETMVLT